MGASNSSEREDGDSSGQDVLDVLQQLAGDLGVRVEVSLEEEEDDGSSGVGQRAAGSGDNDRGEGEAEGREGEGEVEGRESEGEAEGREGEGEESGDEEVECERLATVQLLAKLFGARP